LLTASRAILLLLIVCCMYERNVSFKLDKFFVAYFLIILGVNCYHLTTNTGASIKGIFSLVLEELVLYIVLKSLIRSKEEVEKGLELIVKSSAVVSVLALFETATGKNLFFYLTTTSREMLQTTYQRLGMTRASASFGHPVYYAVYAVCMIPLAMYFFEKTNKKSYAIIAILNIMGVVASGTRGALFVLAALFVVVLLLQKFVVKLKYVRPISFVIPIGLIGVLAIPKLYNFVSGLVISLLTSLGVMDASVADFGANAGGMSSRFMQFSGITWLVKKNALWFGLGYDAPKYGLLSYLHPLSGNWNATNTIDIGYLGHIFLYGVVGLMGFLILYISVFVKAWKRSDETAKDNLYNAFKYFLIAYLICLTTSTGISELFITIIAMMYIYIDLERKEI